MYIGGPTYAFRMDYSLRAARRSDKELLVPWTTHTFAWGDYVLDSFDSWLAHPQSRVLVAADDTDDPVAVARGVLLSFDELWLQGVRVHPDWRRLGIASELGAALQRWGAEQGAKVAYLMTEDWNEAARRQVAGIGFRHTATWLRAFTATEHSGSRARAVPFESTLRRAGLPEAGPAYLAWAGGELSRAARGMMAVSWQWRRLHPADLERAAEHGALFSGPTGWAIAAPRDQYLEVGWMQTSREHARDHFGAILAAATAEKATALQVMIPDLDWLRRGAKDAGFELERLLLFERAL